MDVKKGYLTLTGNLCCVPLVQASDTTTGTMAVTAVDIHQTGYDTAAGFAFTIALQPATARGLVVWVVDTDASADHVGSILVAGRDQNGDAVSETIAMPATTGHAHSVYAYSILTSIKIASCTGTYGEDDHVSVGYDNRFGCPAGHGAIYLEKLVSAFDGAPTTNTLNKTYGTVDMTGTCDGAKEVQIVYTFAVPIVQ
jgi:hypothetical protein